MSAIFGLLCPGRCRPAPVPLPFRFGRDRAFSFSLPQPNRLVPALFCATIDTRVDLLPTPAPRLFEPRRVMSSSPFSLVIRDGAGPLAFHRSLAKPSDVVLIPSFRTSAAALCDPAAIACFLEYLASELPFFLSPLSMAPHRDFPFLARFTPRGKGLLV